MAQVEKGPVLEDDAKETVSLLIEHRLPWLVIGLLGGIVLTFIASRFENLLSQNIGIAYFIPVIVYMADAVGTQTETVFVRNVTKKHAKFSTYLLKEILLGLSLGALFGCLIGLFAFFAFSDTAIALTVGASMFITMATAPAIALIVPTLLLKTHKDPAVGAGPFTTVIQDFVSLLLYFTIASVILFH